MSVSAAFSAEPKWVHVKSADFEIFSSAGEADTRRVLQHFERVHSFFSQLFPEKKDATADPVRIVVFGSAKEYREFRPNEFSSAYYTQTSGRDYIVLGGVSDNAFPTAVHEYMHLVTRHLGLDLPPWLNEGLAELFSTMKPMGDKILIGTIIEGRMQALLQDKWIPLATILAAARDSPYYHEKDKAGALYNEGWALTHMLELSPQYQPAFHTAFQAISNGTPSQAALERTYGKPLSAIEKDLQAYLRKETLKGSLLSAKMIEGPKQTVEPAQTFDVKLSLIDLSNRPGKEADVRRRLEELATEDPKRPEPQARMAYLDWSKGKSLEASREFTKAFDLGDRSPTLLWDYGRLAGNSNDLADANRALTALLALEPDRTDVRIALAGMLLGNNRAKDALDTLSPVKKVTPADAPRLFQLRAYARLQTGDTAAARTNGELWVTNAKDPGEREKAGNFLKSLEPGTKAPDDMRPRLVRKETPEPSQPDVPAPPPFASAKGSFTELDCSGTVPKAIFQTASGKMAFALTDPGKVNITGVGAATVDLNCGPQKDSPVTLEYEGDVLRAIHFEK